MRDNKLAINAAKSKANDRGESIAMIEPLNISEGSPHRGELADLSLELTAKSTSLRKSLPEGVSTALRNLIRSMNCYYSNLIEGHNTHPIDIERALNNDYSQNPNKRDLQLEAKAHIKTQCWIDEGGLEKHPAASQSILSIHRHFCELLPIDMLWAQDPQTKKRIKIKPGTIRKYDVVVGRHVPVSPGSLPRFLERFEQAYARLGKMDSIIAAATAHHRLLWLHPFIDGNGRVARLMSHAMLEQTLNSGGIWSISRGLARNEQAYKAHLAACDLPKRNVLDGRGHLSESCLVDFTKFFLEACLDQIDFMEKLIQPNELRERILIWAEEAIRLNKLPQKSNIVLEAILYRGELQRNEIANILNISERSARRITAVLLEQGILFSESHKTSFHLAFPATLASRWMPGLFPDNKY